MTNTTNTTAPRITDDHLRRAISIALSGGTEEHPYDQRGWGSTECGTPCCVWGHACLLAGVGPASPQRAPAEPTPYAETIARLAQCRSHDILRVMQAVQTDGRIDLRGVELSGAGLSDADIWWANLSGADLSGAKLRYSNLRYSNLRSAILANAILANAILRGVDLSDADLRGVDLSDADLRTADLRNADLRNADLSEADLRDARLAGADLRDADLTGATMPDGTVHD